MDFTDIMLEHKSPLKAFAINLTRDRDDAMDLIQETYYRAYYNRDKFHEGTNIKAWLLTIMKNIFINNYRRAVNRNTINDSSENLYLLQTGAGVVNNQAERDFLLNDLNLAVAKLDEEYRVPFNMHIEGFKYEEIADELDIPLGTVKSRIFFARKKMQEFLRQKEFDRY